MRRTLDTLYRLAAAAGALCLFAILVLVATQVGARLLDWGLTSLGLAATGFIVPSLAEIAGYLLAAATFLALADTLAHAVHIRVNLVSERLPARVRGVLDGLVAFVAAALCVFATYALGAYALKSLEHGDVSYGMVRVPLALPQGVMCLGLFVLAIALIDQGVAAFRGRPRAGAVDQRGL